MRSRRILHRGLAWPAAVMAALVAPALLFVTTAHEGHEGPWIVPEAETKVKNPVAPSAESLARGKDLYARNCLSCHGEKGDGKGPVAQRLGFTAGDLTNPMHVGHDPDGALAWKIATGRDPMPAFKKDKGLTDAQIWDLVNYVRTFSAGAGKSPHGH